MPMPDLWSPDAMVPKPRVRACAPVAIVPRDRIDPRRPGPPKRPVPPAAARREVEIQDAWHRGFQAAERKFNVNNAKREPAKLRPIIIEVAAKHGLRPEEVTSERRIHTIVRARHEAMWRCFRETVCSYTDIGRAFKKDHTTVIHGVAKHEERLAALGQRPVEESGFRA